ncbi:uncharacterized protein BDR25DRAFT_376684 [Lindgomyces ingoldianus]|uniref:Uncharacterized protein n=1 Tax=Lindgomyces ingoldianus TaxID=673940 RepID=A0ACB6QJM3_9PLEO|nr:uncharacterized protein BDR25DRAFT_376684 [Lindgomyces ingoldianus]KAF2467072.1 hypothetical protein BDR25DRAFT_376684 [Lindgomyces ingoldianus]
MFPLPSAIFKTKSYQDLRGSFRNRAPYTNSDNAAITGNLPQSTIIDYAYKDSTDPEVVKQAQPVDTPDETITALPERRPRHKISTFFGSHSPATETQPAVATDENQRSEKILALTKLGDFFKGLFKSARFRRKKTAKERRPPIQIGSPYNFRHHAGEGPGPLRPSRIQLIREERGEGDSEWEDMEDE